MKIEIHNGRLIDPAHGVDRKSSLYIAAGKVAALDEPPPGWHPNRVIDASRLVVCPGLIDASARLREPGFEYKATLESEMEAAVAGGVTSLAARPTPIRRPTSLVWPRCSHRARSLNWAHVYPWVR
jgi:dihydroorotase